MAVTERMTDDGMIREHGSIGPYECPKCDKQKIQLTESRSGFGLFAMLGIGTSWALGCDCGYRLEVPASQVMDARGRVDMMDAYTSGRLEQEDAMKRFSMTHFPTLTELEEHGRKWTCSGCKEEVPMTFETCWQCGTDCPEEHLKMLAPPEKSSSCGSC